MNENESRRESRMNRKILTYLDKKIEDFISSQLTEADKVHATNLQEYETFLSLSKERRALIRLLDHQEDFSD